MPIYLEQWFWDNKVVRFLLRAAQLAAPIAAFLATLWAIQQTERHFFPVVTGWTLDYIEKRDGKLEMGGKLFKDRSCELVNTLVVGVPKSKLLPHVVIYQVSPNELAGADIPVGYHTWGPWAVAVPKTLIAHKDELAGFEVVGRHKCHPLWLQETRYGFVPIERVPL